MIGRVERLVFTHRRAVLAVFLLATLLLALSATRLRVDAGFEKLLPTGHEYMRTFAEYGRQFGGANRVLVALMARDGDMFDPAFFDALRRLTDDVFFIPGVDRPQVRSLFTPNVRYTEVVEDGIQAGNVVPDDFVPTPEGLARVRENILKAGIVGRLVASDFSGALVVAQLLERDPLSGERLDYRKVAERLEQLRARYEDERHSVHIIGFAKVIGDITDGARRVVAFFGVSFALTALLVWWYAQSLRVAAVPIACSLVAVVWGLGALPLAGFGIDPMSILVPFLVFAIGVSHGVQMVSAIRAEAFAGADALAAARASFRRLIVPGGIALASDTVGFLAILVIPIAIIREMALTAAIGVLAIIATNLVLLPVLASFLVLDDGYRHRIEARRHRLQPLWTRLAGFARPRAATAVVAVSLMLALAGGWLGARVQIGDLHRGVPELRPDSRYNRDSALISERFTIGVDMLGVVVESPKDGCIDFDIMSRIDDFSWVLRNAPHVQSVAALPAVAKVINAGWNEGSLAWRALPRNRDMLVQSVAYVPTSSGLLNGDCTALPVYVFATDHRAGTIATLVDTVKRYRAGAPADEGLRYRLATGNLGVMAATNEVVAAAQFPIVGYVFGAVVLLCLVSYRTLRGVLCIVLPLALVSVLGYALMTVARIGLKVNTLPVVALGVGIGVDYGIYIYGRLRAELAGAASLAEAFERTLDLTGVGVIFTGLTLAAGVATWIASPLKFQADMGVLLTFMFVLNMLGAIVLLPALAWLLRLAPRGSQPTQR